jgi:predicted HAD superfamily Cof-like phosphohydrolase
MRDLHAYVAKFMRAAKQPIRQAPGWPGEKVADLGYCLIAEEFKELVDAMNLVYAVRDNPTPDRLAGVADALGDLLYVVAWTGLAWGFDMPAIMAEIQKANMAKFGPGGGLQPNGKVMKPPGWTPPDVEKLMGRPVFPLTRTEE